ncbi:MAG: type II 3-dehydroquinate dehydratase [Elusimicrobia bacterium]|nr:MAG: type II 3-dehydroquinate dehydratase [Elusimicrobiota bacterium]
MKVLVLNGPNLNLLGEREPAVYGRTTLAEIDRDLKKLAKSLRVSLRSYQRNGEGELLDILHKQRNWADGLLINPGAYTHYSYALRDGIASVALPAIEIHLSDIRKREPFRRKSVIRDVCIGRVMGKGPDGYGEALKLLLKKIRS